MFPQRSSSPVSPVATLYFRRVFSACTLAFGLTVLPALVPAVGTSPLGLHEARAQGPMTITGTRVLDNSSVLGDTGELKDKISRLSKDHKVDLHIITIDKFENPSEAPKWATELGKKNNWGTADAVLIIATESRQAYFSANGTKNLSREQQSKVYQDYVKPKLDSSGSPDYRGAALAAIEGIEMQKSSWITRGIAKGDPLVLGLVGTAGAAAATGGGIYLYRRRQNKKASREATEQPQIPQESIEQLRTRAGSSLVQADNTLVRARQEVEFARAQYGDSTVAEYEQELARADELMKASFHRQQLLTDNVPDTPTEQRAWLSEIIDNSTQIIQLVQEQDQKLASLRDLEKHAPETIDRRRADIPSLQQRAAEATSLYESLQERYLPGALEPVKQTPQLLSSSLALLPQELDAAAKVLATSRSEAVVHLRAAEEAAGQITTLSDAVHHRASELEAAQEHLGTELLSVQRDIAEAKSLASTQNRHDLQAVADGMDAVLSQVSEQANARPNDPLALTERLRQLNSELDKSMTSLRADRDRQRAAEQSLERTLRSARVQVESARSFIHNRRGGVGYRARTCLSEAETHLMDAQRLSQSDPAGALDSANRAIALASDAQSAAHQDMDGYYGGRGTGDSSLAEGMLLGALLSSLGGHHHSSGGWSSGDSGGFGGGFGGGGGDFGGGDGGSF